MYFVCVIFLCERLVFYHSVWATSLLQSCCPISKLSFVLDTLLDRLLPVYRFVKGSAAESRHVEDGDRVSSFADTWQLFCCTFRLCASSSLYFCLVMYHISVSVLFTHLAFLHFPHFFHVFCQRNTPHFVVKVIDFLCQAGLIFPETRVSYFWWEFCQILSIAWKKVSAKNSEVSHVEMHIFNVFEYREQPGRFPVWVLDCRWHVRSW